MRKLSWWIVVQAAAFFIAAWTYGTVLAQTAPEIEKAAADVVRLHELQTELSDTSKEIKELRSDKFLDRFLDFFPGSLIEWIFWGGVILLAALFIYAFREYLYIPALIRRGQADWDEENDINGAHVPSSAKEAELTADELAKQGAFTEAMHVLLLRAVAELRLRLNEHYTDSMTSREILGRARIPDNGRQAFQDIVARVEWSYFGAYPAELSDYQACRENFTRLISGLQSMGRT
jgi:hypothetical protein